MILCCMDNTTTLDNSQISLRSLKCGFLVVGDLINKFLSCRENLAMAIVYDVVA